MAHYLLDTNILWDLIRNPQGVVARKLEVVGEQSVCTSVVVACELRFGAAKKGSARLSQNVEAVLAAIEVLDLRHGADVLYGKLRDRLERDGQLIGGNDLLIAVHALAEKLVLVTNNERAFRRVPHLKIENWLS